MQNGKLLDLDTMELTDIIDKTKPISLEPKNLQFVSIPDLQSDELLEDFVLKSRQIQIQITKPDVFDAEGNKIIVEPEYKTVTEYYLEIDTGKKTARLLKKSNKESAKTKIKQFDNTKNKLEDVVEFCFDVKKYFENE
jgi:hypothetical protein